MGDWVITENALGYSQIDVVDTAATAPLGTIVRARHLTYGMGEFIYLQGVASTAVGTWVTYNSDDWTTARLVADASGPVAVAMAATVASRFGWYQISGKAVGLVAAGFVDNALVYATATAGTVDDAVVAGDRVKLARGASAINTPATGFAEFEIHRPFADDGASA
jgi:hypothetical protein